MPPEVATETATLLPSPDALHGRVILVTGANSGLGQACACACAQAGATVILLARDIPRLEKTYDLVREQGGPEPTICPLDLTGAVVADFRDLAKRIEADFGRLDGVLNNAGLVGGLRPMRLLEADDWSRILRINLLGPWLLTQACLDLLEQAEDPSIVFTLDQRAQRAYWGAYGVAKAGLASLVPILAQELDGDRRIRVNGIDPGPMETRLRQQNYPGEAGGTQKSPEQVAPAIVYLLGPDSREMTGEVVTLP